VAVYIGADDVFLYDKPLLSMDVVGRADVTSSGRLDDSANLDNKRAPAPLSSSSVSSIKTELNKCTRYFWFIWVIFTHSNIPDEDYGCT
jgi:hypothetical protein